MADNGRRILGTYSAACETIRGVIPRTTAPKPGDIIFFSGTRHSGANHIGIIYKVTSSTVYTVEGNTSGASGVVDNGGGVAAKSYSKANSRILSYGRPNYSQYNADPQVVMEIAAGEIGYVEKRSNSNLNSKTANAGSANYTKYGAWIGANGDYWCASFVSWCFHAAYDDSAGNIGSAGSVIGLTNDYTDSGSSDDLEINIGQTQGNSNLVTYVNRLSGGKHKVRENRIARITIHIARRIGDIHDLSEMLNSSDKSYNYGIDNDGVIGLFVDETEWTSSSNNKANDKTSVNIICMNTKLAPNYEISNDCMKSLRKLCEDICRRNFIFKLEYTGHPDLDTLTLHKDFNPLSECPGPYLEKQIPSLTKKVTDKIGAEIKPNQVIVKARLATSETEALKAQSTIAIKSIKPYVIAPSPSATNVDYAALKELGVVGAMLDAGARYDKNHNIIRYRNENIYVQTLEAQNAGLFHSYIYTTRARTAKEVREEAYWFYFVLSKYPPKLGIWLRCDFDVKSELAQKLVEEWYYFFVDWGLKSKCGLRATKKQAEKIGWPKQCEYLPLWLEGELPENVCPDEEILTPSFFKMDDLTNKGFNISTTSIESLPGIIDYDNYPVSSPELSEDGGVSIPSNWNGTKLTKSLGTVQGPSGKETYYDLDMYGVVQIMKRDLKLDANYWEREDGCKMYGSYIMVAADLSTRPRGSTIATSLGMAMVCDTGLFAHSNPTQLDIATNWTKGPHYWEKKEGRTIQ